MATQAINNLQSKSLCDLPPVVANAVEQEAVTTMYPTGAVLFAEGQVPRGIFIVRRGRVKLSICCLLYTSPSPRDTR